MSLGLTVITHPTSDTKRPSILVEDLLTGQRNIVGNIPAGLQRKCSAMKIKTARLENIFLTGIINWDSIAGLPGLILTVSDQGVKNLGIYHSGNNVIQYLISCFRYFIFRFGLNMKVQDTNKEVDTGKFVFHPVNISSDISFENNEGKDDDILKLTAIMSGIFPIPTSASSPSYNSKRVADVTLPKSIVNPQVSASWIFTPTPTRGKFRVQAAKELGCKVEHFKKLCSFKNVTLESGEVINPEQVLEPTKYYNPVLFLEIPSTGHLTNTIRYDWMSKSNQGLPYAAVYHFINESIKEPLSSPEYIKFIDSFGPHTLHLISHSSYSPNLLNFKRTYFASLKWKSLLGPLFPLPKWSSQPQLPIPKQLYETGRVLPMISGQRLTLKSNTSASLEEETRFGSDPNIVTSEELDDLYSSEISPVGLSDVATKKDFDLFIQNAPKAKSLAKEVKNDIPLRDQVETLVLGTGSAIPSLTRNVISNILRIPYTKTDGTRLFKTVVLDAGENTLGTLKRTYTAEEVGMLFDELEIIYLSHLHADHHLGIIDIIKEWNIRQLKKPKNERKILFIISPWQFSKFVQEINQIEDVIDFNMIRYLSCEEFNQGKKFAQYEQLKIENVCLSELTKVNVRSVEFTSSFKNFTKLFNELNIKYFDTCPANHCDYAYSCAIEFILESDNTFKVSYSGDTRPRFEFSNIGKKSDLLIHESTLEDDKFTDASEKRHTTTSEAIHVGIIMEAKKILLTHFSQRYQSFNGFEDIYDRLANPKTLSDFSNVIETDDVEKLPIELRSKIFEFDLKPSAIKNAHNIEVVLAFDNMKIKYGNFNDQRKIFEREGTRKLELLFARDTEIDEEENGGDATKQTKKDSKKKRKLET